MIRTFLLLLLPEKLISMIVMIHPLSCHHNIFLRVHSLKLEPTIALNVPIGKKLTKFWKTHSCYGFNHFVHIKILGNLERSHVHIIIRVQQSWLLLTALKNMLNFSSWQLCSLNSPSMVLTSQESISWVSLSKAVRAPRIAAATIRTWYWYIVSICWWSCKPDGNRINC